MDNIIQIKISLRGTKPLIWRRILVEKMSTFDALHEGIQIAMGWTNSHLHEFTADGVRIGQPLDEFDMDYGEKLTNAICNGLALTLIAKNKRLIKTLGQMDAIC